jgi:hypothetical protein
LRTHNTLADKKENEAIELEPKKIRINGGEIGVVPPPLINNLFLGFSFIQAGVISCVAMRWRSEGN